MSDERKYVAVVDAFSAGNLLAPEFASRGYGVIHVRSAREVEESLRPTFRTDDFLHHLNHKGNLRETVERLEPFQPLCVVAGAETGVELADALSERLGLPTNGTRKSKARRPAIRAQVAGGTEYLVNTVSCGGEHRFAEIWKLKRRLKRGRDATPTHDRNDLMPFDGDIQQRLQHFVRGVLEVLEISYGPAHTKVLVTKDGPILSAFGACLEGLSSPSVSQQCVGYGPVDLTVDAYLDRESFLRKTSLPYTLKKHSLKIYLSKDPGIAKIKRLQSFFQMRAALPHLVTLVHPDLRTVRSDYEQIRLIEARNALTE